MADLPAPTDDLDQLKRALAALKKARARIDALEQARSEPIAIIGIGCRLPGNANTPQAFWQLLRQGRSAMVEAPPDRWDAAAYLAASPDEPGKMQSALSGFLEGIDQFDPHFFGISPREANAMDPQQRLALEAAWEALEDAGIIPASLAGSATGVFIGIGINDYGRLQIPGQALDPTRMDNYFIQGNALCITANRISYALDLHGPSMAIDTACSSSLVAIHAACHSLRRGESTLALVGGSNVILSPDNSIGLGKFLAPDGLCKTFDAAANGYTRGEGSVIFVLRRLSEAVAANDRIYAVILGSATNQDGFSSGLTVPNGAAQEAMLRAALQNAGVQPGEIDYLEAHGTGTSLGDPIEANALGAVFAPGRSPGQELWIGSVKTNIGHLEAGAGIAGVLKTALALYYGEIPPSLNFSQPNPLIDFDALRLRVATELTPWPQRPHPRRAGISSFGFGGANAHAILQAPPAPADAPAAPPRPAYLFTLSAKTPPALMDHARRFAEHLGANPALPIAALCETVNRQRARFTHRLAVAADDLSGLGEALAAFAAGQPGASVASGQAVSPRPRIAFLFTGQGSQYVGMGRQLYETEPVFRAALELCDAILRPLIGASLLEILYPPAGAQSQPPRIDDTTYTQPAMFALEIALAALWKSWGVEPDAVMGHSVGEYAAAVIAGVMSLEDGLKLIAARGRLMGGLPEGGVMAAVFAPLDRIQAVIDALRPADRAGTLAVAAINGPQSIVISGAAAEVQAALDQFQAQGVKHRSLVVSHAFHSPLMDPILDELEQVAASCRYQPPQVTLLSNVSGRAFGPGEAPDAAYWRRHVRQPVNFAAEIQTLHEQGVELFVEIGPHPTLLGMGARCLPEGVGAWLPSLRQGQPDLAVMLKSLGALYCRGQEINWDALHGEVRRPPLSLPTYPFQRERYWFRTNEASRRAQRSEARGDYALLGSRLRSPLLQGAVFEIQLDPAGPGYLWDHRAYGTAIFPATGYIEMALSAAIARAPGGTLPVLEALTIQEALVLPADGAVTVQVALTPEADGRLGVQIFSLPSASPGAEPGDWLLHAEARLRPAVAARFAPHTLGGAQSMCPVEVAPAEFYAFLRQAGMEYGPAFQNIRQLWRGEGRSLAYVQLPEALSTDGYTIHPALLDAGLQTLGIAISQDGETFMPLGFDQVQIWADPGRELWSYAVLKAAPAEADRPEALSGDVTLFSTDGQPIGEISGMRLKRASRQAVERLVQRAAGRPAFADWLYRMDWRPQALEPAAPTAPIAGRWLILSDSPAGSALAGQIEGAVLATPGESPIRLSSDHWQADFARPQEVRRLVTELAPDGVVCLVADLRAGLHLLQAAAGAPALPAVWLATLGAQPVSSPDVHVDSAALWGLARSARLEMPDLRLHCIDLDPASLPEHNAETLWAEIQAQSTEDEIAYRNDVRYVSRLAPAPAAAAESRPVRLEITARGVLDNLALRPMQRRPLQPGEVEIGVRATGLNFRDVLNTLGMYPGEAGALGHECSGVVTGIGPGVTGLQPGQPVLALAGDCFASYAVARGEFVMPKPAGMSFEQAASVPITFLTAAYALETLGGMRSGERVLIHAAAGGVGLAAVQLARSAGLEIFATAGSPEKRAFLHRLGVQHVLDSRSLAFAAEIMRRTNGQGVDLVLNSLADEWIPASLGVLRAGGRFLEIGKRGIWTPEQVAALGKGIDYHIIYLGEVCERQPALINDLFTRLMARFAAGDLQPLPWRAFPLAQAVEAFRFMAQARHVGKIVLTQPPAPNGPPAIRPEATYLVTGGLGGLGLVAAGRLVEAGARRLVLAGRSAPGPAAAVALEQMAARGAQVVVLQADLSQAAEVERLLETIRREHPPLAGIVHAAGRLQDGLLAQQDWSRFSEVLAPKLGAAWALHRLTSDAASPQALDFFVLFSAGAGWLGSAGQTGYAAANTALDALACYRQARGLPAVSIAWGPWAEVGMAARLDAAGQERLNRQGLGAITPHQGAELFERLLGAGGALAALPVDWARYAASQAGPAPRFRELAGRARPAASAGKPARPAAAPDVLQRLSEAAPSKRKSLLQAHIREQAIRVLGLSLTFALDSRQPLRELGLDSLMAVELRNALGASLQRKLTATLLFDYPTLEALTDYLSQELWPAEAEAPAAVQPQAEQQAAAQEIDELQKLSEAEAEALLLQELASLKKGRS